MKDGVYCKTKVDASHPFQYNFMQLESYNLLLNFIFLFQEPDVLDDSILVDEYNKSVSLPCAQLEDNIQPNSKATKQENYIMVHFMRIFDYKSISKCSSLCVCPAGRQ